MDAVIFGSVACRWQLATRVVGVWVQPLFLVRQGNIERCDLLLSRKFDTALPAFLRIWHIIQKKEDERLVVVVYLSERPSWRSFLQGFPGRSVGVLMTTTLPLSIINFEGSEFSGSEFSRSEFSGSEFSRSEFSGSEFSGSEFSGSEFSGSEFSRSEFSGSEV